MINPNDIETIKIQLASPETISGWAYKQKPGIKDIDRAWAHGEITDNNHNQKEAFSIYSQQIFGPKEDYTCACTNKTINPYTLRRYIRQGAVCKKCGVAITGSRLRRERLGYINLVLPVANPLYISKIAKLIRKTETSVREVLDYKKEVIIYTRTVSLSTKGNSITQDITIPRIRFHSFPVQSKKRLHASPKIIARGTGGEIILTLLKLYNRNTLQYLRDTLKPNKVNQSRIDIIQSFLESSVKPEHMILRNLPVLPPDLRTNSVVNNMIYTNPLNEVYASIVSVNNALQKAEKPLSPFYYIEGRKLQTYVNALFIDKYAHVIKGLKNYKALSTGLAKKSGVFRRYLLGKRVNYSARSVILADPKLRFNYCRIPKRIALELFRPFLVNLLCKSKSSLKISDAEKEIDLAIEHAEEFDLHDRSGKIPGQNVFTVLNELLDASSPTCPVVLLNRTPTLHKLGIQAFIPSLGDDNAIHLHPLVCAGYNADFDGDTMAIHLPLTKEAQAEARQYMLASRNILSPGTGKPLAVPTQDMVLGLYYNSLEKNSSQDNFEPYTKKFLAKKIDDEFEPSEPEKTAKQLDNYMSSGYFYATEAGLSIAATDFPQPAIGEKIELIHKAEATEALTAEAYIEQWCDVSSKLYEKLQNEGAKNPKDAFQLISASGARGNDEQFKQICVMRGLFKDTRQNVIQAPVKSSLMEGMSSLEYFISCHGTRKGLTDTALNTAESGYLTRRLIYAVQEVVISEEDCSTVNTIPPGIDIPLPEKNVEKDELNAFVQRILGRYQVVKDGDGYIDKFLTKKNAAKTVRSYIHNGKSLLVRSALTCQSQNGICQKCYGEDPSTRLPVRIGTPVGIIAAQSLSEPTTQFVLRTFHNGGSASTQDITDSMEELMHLYDNNNQLKLQEMLDSMGIEKFRLYMLDKLRTIYNNNGVDIKDVHIEVILRKMLKKLDNGMYEIRSVEKCAKEAPGFLKTASFEETGPALADAALRGTTDYLDTIAACVMLGKDLPIKII